MISDIKLWDSQHLTYVSLDDLNYPLQKFEWAYPVVGDNQPRPFTGGRHNSRKSVSYMTLDCEGEILGSSTSDYWTKRKALAYCALPKAIQASNIYRHSFMEITLDDGSSYHADLQMASYSIPLSASGAPTVSPFMFSWEINEGYWSDVYGSLVQL